MTEPHLSTCGKAERRRSFSFGGRDGKAEPFHTACGKAAAIPRDPPATDVHPKFLRYPTANRLVAPTFRQVWLVGVGSEVCIVMPIC